MAGALVEHPLNLVYRFGVLALGLYEHEPFESGVGGPGRNVVDAVGPVYAQAV